MIAFMVSYWLGIIPTAVAGMFLLGVLKKIRDEKARSEKSLVPLEVWRKQG